MARHIKTGDTVIVVTGRCVVWMPWYVLRTLRTGAAGDQ